MRDPDFASQACDAGATGRKGTGGVETWRKEETTKVTDDPEV